MNEDIEVARLLLLKIAVDLYTSVVHDMEEDNKTISTHTEVLLEQFSDNLKELDNLLDIERGVQ